MKKLFAALTLALTMCVCALAQSPMQNLYAAGVSYNQSGTPAVAGTALFAHSVNDGSGTYAFAVYDALPQNTKPFTVTSNLGFGVAQQAFKVGNYSVFVPTSAGVSFSGSNTGWAWSTGVGVPVKLKSTSNWYLMPTARVVKSSVAGGTGYQPVVSVLFGWGQ